MKDFMEITKKPFSQWGLHPNLLNAIEELGFQEPTPIQQKCYPLVTGKKDIAGLAQTGTGKTAAFLIPTIQRILASLPGVEASLAEQAFTDWSDKSFILVMVPTRELVTQVHENFKQLAKKTDLKAVTLYGGVGYDEQKESLSKPFDFLIATPGRLIDLYKDHHLDLKQVRGVIFDEADRMFDMGFQDDVFYVLRRVPKDRQLLFFSATLNLTVTEMAYEFEADPIEVDVSRDQATADNVEDFISHLGHKEKPKYLLTLLKKYEPQQVIIFSNFKSKVKLIADFLNSNGHSALGISSLLSQSQRNTVMKKFKEENQHNILVATDVAARGLDIKGVDMVINFELPDDAENYVHRIGRTGRADRKGQAFSFVSDKDVEAMMRIEDYLKEKVEVLWIEDTEFVEDFKEFPQDRPRFSKGRDDHRGSGGRSSQGRRKKTTRKPSGKKTGGQRADGSGESREERSDKKPQERGVHRDKRTGRHKKRRHEQSASSSSNGSSKKAQGSKKTRTRRRKSSGKKAQPAQQGFIFKVTSSIKSLFGG